MKHEHSESQQMKTSQRFWPTLIVASQATKTGCPGKTALNNPSARQQNEATFGFWQFDHLQTYPLVWQPVLAHCPCNLDPRKPPQHGNWSLLVQPPPIRLPRARSCSSAGVTNKVSSCPGYQLLHGLCCLCAAWLHRSPLDVRFRARLQRSTVKNGGRWVLVTPLSQSQHRSQSLTMASKTPAFSQRCVC